MSSSNSLIGKQLDEYRLEKLLGKGGMAAVYLAVDTRLKRHAAIKVITSPFRANSDYIERFEREAQAVAQLDHPNIITLYRYGEVDNLLYMAMQYIDGANLEAVIESYHAEGDLIEPQEILRLTQEIGAALDYSHNRGVIHRDIKPSNIMIDQDGRAIVVDFGLALLTEIGTQGQVFGSPRYIAPEQAISSAGVVPQSDLYSVGVILFEMFTGQVPFDAADPLDLAMKHLSEPPPNPRNLRPDLSPEIEGVILTSLAKEPGDRYPTGAALFKALKAAMETASAAAITPTKRTHTTIPEKVALEVAENPLPPLPVISTPPNPPPAAQTALHRQKQARRSYNQGGIVLLLGMGATLLIGVVLMGALLLSRARNNAPTPSPDITTIVESAATTENSILSTMPLVNSPSVPTAAPFILSTENPPAQNVQPASTIGGIVLPTAMPLTAFPTPPSATIISATLSPPIGYELELVWEREDSLFVINRSASDFPLFALGLAGERGELDGSEWEVPLLPSGSCVAVWKDSGNPRAATSDCTLVGKHVTREGRERFWRSGVDVLLYGQKVASCKSSPCTVRFELISN